jgi:hypothetical protein
MIPKASQRAGGQDLATHLLNAADNEYVEVAEVSGAVAHDLHGAFAEWEAIAAGLTKCRNYLYSLSVNPDLAQGDLTRAQYLDYLDRTEKALGLEGQPRAVVFHIKDGREHCHCVWSRIDWQREKAVHIAFDREKLMMVTRQFARDHGLALPDGYDRAPGEKRGQQLSLYETQQQRATGITKEERRLMVTQAWRQSDSPKAFVRALEEMGYMLATGDRPYVLVDMYGGMHALPRLLDGVKSKAVVARLGVAFPVGQLPTVDEARALVAQHRAAREQFAKAQDDGRKREQLKAMQERRRAGLLAEQAALAEAQKGERAVLAGEQRGERRALRAGYLAQVRAVKAAREAGKPVGLAAFLGRVTGVALVIAKVQRHRDAQRYRGYVAEKQALAGRQADARLVQQRGQELRATELARQVKALAKVEKRELKALEESRLREQRQVERVGHEHMPALKLGPRGRGASVRKAQNRYKDSLRTPEEKQKRVAAPEKATDLSAAHRAALAADKPLESRADARGDFNRAAGSGGDSDGGGDDSGGIRPVARASRPEGRGSGRGRRDDFERER